MRDLSIILNEVHKQATVDNCQSWNAICLTAMEQALNEQKEDIIQKLENLSNSYESSIESYIIRKDLLGNFIENL